jgi:predicted ATP-dependent endonuclease of OLD family
MQLGSLQIHNFRGIRDFATPIEFHEYTLLVGANDFRQKYRHRRDSGIL